MLDEIEILDIETMSRARWERQEQKKVELNVRFYIIFGDFIEGL